MELEKYQKFGIVLALSALDPDLKINRYQVFKAKGTSIYTIKGDDLDISINTHDYSGLEEGFTQIIDYFYDKEFNRYPENYSIETIEELFERFYEKFTFIDDLSDMNNYYAFKLNTTEDPEEYDAQLNELSDYNEDAITNMNNIIQNTRLILPSVSRSNNEHFSLMLSTKLFGDVVGRVDKSGIDIQSTLDDISKHKEEWSQLYKEMPNHNWLLEKIEGANDIINKKRAKMLTLAILEPSIDIEIYSDPGYENRLRLDFDCLNNEKDNRLHSVFFHNRTSQEKETIELEKFLYESFLFSLNINVTPLKEIEKENYPNMLEKVGLQALKKTLKSTSKIYQFIKVQNYLDELKSLRATFTNFGYEQNIIDAVCLNILSFYGKNKYLEKLTTDDIDDVKLDNVFDKNYDFAKTIKFANSIINGTEITQEFGEM